MSAANIAAMFLAIEEDKRIREELGEDYISLFDCLPDISNWPIPLCIILGVILGIAPFVIPIIILEVCKLIWRL